LTRFSGICYSRSIHEASACSGARAFLRTFCPWTSARSDYLYEHHKIGPEKVRVIFNVPVTPVGITNVLSDDFSSAEIDTGKWRINDSPFEVRGALGVRSVLQI
jgi:hypothetical protein